MEKFEGNMSFSENLWKEYEPSLRKICAYKLSSCPAEIDDVISEVYLALCDAIDNDKNIRSPKAWLYATLNNQIKLKYTEIEKMKKKYINLDSVQHKLTYDINFDEQELDEEFIEKMKDEIFDELIESEKTLLILIYEKKLKFKEIAKILHTTESAVKQKNYRLKRKIKFIAKEKLK